MDLWNSKQNIPPTLCRRILIAVFLIAVLANKTEAKEMVKQDENKTFKINPPLIIIPVLQLQKDGKSACREGTIARYSNEMIDLSHLLQISA